MLDVYLNWTLCSFKLQEICCIKTCFESNPQQRNMVTLGLLGSIWQPCKLDRDTSIKHQRQDKTSQLINSSSIWRMSWINSYITHAKLRRRKICSKNYLLQLSSILFVINSISIIVFLTYCFRFKRSINWNVHFSDIQLVIIFSLM